MVMFLYVLVVIDVVDLMVLRVSVDEKLELRFRELAMKRFKYSKGALSRALEEAIMKWISDVESEEFMFEGDPVEAIDGLLADIDIDSVELQHRIRDLWVLKAVKNVSGGH